MTRSYFLSQTNSDLTGGVNFNKELATATETVNFIALSLPNLTNRIDYAWTPAGDPGTDGATGNYTVKVNITVADANVTLFVALYRVNSAGTVQGSVSEVAGQNLGTTGVKTFEFTNVDLGTWAAGDRLRVHYRWDNASQHGGDEVIHLQTGTVNAEVITPFAAGAPPIDGSLAETQDDQTLSSSGTLGLIGSLTETQDDQTLSASGAVTAAGVAGSLSETQDDQTLTASGQLGHTGQLVQTQSDQTLSASGTVTAPTITGSLSETQDDQTLTASGTVTPPSPGVLVEDPFNRADSDIVGNDSEGNAWVEVSGDWDIFSNGVIQTNANSVPGLLRCGTVIDTDHWIEATLAASNGSGQIGFCLRVHATAFTGVFMEVADGAFKVIQVTNGEPDTVSVGSLHTHATGERYRAEVEGNTVRLFLNDVEVHSFSTSFAAGNSRVGLHLNENASGAVKFVNFRGGTLPYTAPSEGTTGSLAETQDDQTLSSSGTLGLTGSLVEIQDDQTLAASGEVLGPITGSLTKTQDDQTLAASGHLGLTGSLAKTQGDQTLTASGEVLGLITGSLVETQDDQTLAASGQLGLAGQLAETQDDQMLTAAGVVSGIVLVDITIDAFAPVLAHGSAFAPEMIERIPLAPEITTGAPDEPISTHAATGDPALGHGDSGDPTLGHGDAGDPALHSGVTGSPTR